MGGCASKDTSVNKVAKEADEESAGFVLLVFVVCCSCVCLCVCVRFY